MTVLYDSTYAMWERYTEPKWIHSPVVESLEEGESILRIGVSDGYIYGFMIYSEDANDFRLTWTSNGSTYSVRLSLPSPGTISYFSAVPINEGLPITENVCVSAVDSMSGKCRASILVSGTTPAKVSVTRKFTIILTPSDPHWVRLGNGKYAVELSDRWEARTPYSDWRYPRPYIDIKIPELQGSSGGKITIRWYSNDWHYIALKKSADGVNFTTVWERNAHYPFNESHTMDIDPNCIYYRIHFEDGNFDYEVTGVYKNVEVEIYA
jgi:hypothetical protein